MTSKACGLRLREQPITFSDDKLNFRQYTLLPEPCCRDDGHDGDHRTASGWEFDDQGLVTAERHRRKEK